MSTLVFSVETVGESVVELTSSCSLVGEVTRLTNARQNEVREVNRFLGVPYAEPPVGDLMFRDPQTVKLWQGQREAKKFGPACPQNLSLMDMLPFKIPKPSAVSEDCLHLNVWTPNTSSVAKLPVMVWFYGGGFVFGYTDFYDGGALANFHDVVIVTVGYRVGVWGFLCTGDAAATGNYGLLDQVESLRWIQKHISKFGGDPNNVTIFGESAGGVSTAYHMMSPLSRGLFKNCISQSGTAILFGETKTPQQALEALKPFLKHLGCESTNGEGIVSHLRSLPSEKLVLPFELMTSIVFVPVIDGKMITESSHQSLRNGNLAKANHLIGANSDEGALLGSTVCLMSKKEFKDIDLTTIADLVKAGLYTRYGGKDTTKLVEAILKEYFDNVKPGDEMVHNFMHVLGDSTFVVPAVVTADAQAAHSSVYLYSYEMRHSYSKYPDFVKADHGFEVAMVFGMPFLTKDAGFTEQEEKISRKLMAYWTNFAKTGNPNGSGLEHWPEYTCTERKYLVLDVPVTQSADLKSQRVKFWSKEADNYIN